MKISILQYKIAWLNPKKNLDYIDENLKSLDSKTDLVILPEMFATGFTSEVETCFETMDGAVISFLKERAATYDIAICGSLLIKENEKYYNRFVFVKPNGEIQTYDKRHCFTYSGEDKIITAGKENIIIEYKGWRIKPMICYDLRFPVWSRNTENYDILIYVANWPKARYFAYRTLITARAIENQCYVCACNCVGTDGNNILYDGNSMIIDAKGQTVADAESLENVISAELDKESLEKFRLKFPVLKDGDDFLLK